MAWPSPNPMLTSGRSDGETDQCYSKNIFPLCRILMINQIHWAFVYNIPTDTKYFWYITASVPIFVRFAWRVLLFSNQLDHSDCCRSHVTDTKQQFAGQGRIGYTREVDVWDTRKNCWMNTPEIYHAYYFYLITAWYLHPASFDQCVHKMICIFGF